MLKSRSCVTLFPPLSGFEDPLCTLSRQRRVNPLQCYQTRGCRLGDTLDAMAYADRGTLFLSFSSSTNRTPQPGFPSRTWEVCNPSTSVRPAGDLTSSLHSLTARCLGSLLSTRGSTTGRIPLTRRRHGIRWTPARCSITGFALYEGPSESQTCRSFAEHDKSKNEICRSSVSCHKVP